MAPIDIFCDESGYTGTRLLDPEQRVFSFAAVAVSDAEAWSILDVVRQRHGVLGVELKATTLLKTEAGRALVLDSLRAIAGRYRFVIFDKLLGLCTKLFEYIYEPVFKDDPDLLYQKDLHRFVGMYCYMFFVSQDPVAERALREFEQFMRTLDPALAPSLFDPGQALDEENPFEMVRRFAQGYRHLILKDNLDGLSEMADGGKWTLDLGISGLWSLLSHFGAGGAPLRVLCDRSRPLEVVAVMLDAKGIAASADYGRDRFEREEPRGWTPAAPIAFGDSRDHPGLQLADLVAGAVTACLRGDLERRGLTEIAGKLDEHQHPHSIMPDFSLLDLKTRTAVVNWVMLHGLGERARNGQNPHALLRELFARAELGFDRGEFRAMTSDP
ncbi:MAG: hypothetical protein JWR80_2893 [Bradyrhizobium sp.]|nr:hypothetical protein [Bradyrhizobium sp.]